MVLFLAEKIINSDFEQILYIFEPQFLHLYFHSFNSFYEGPQCDRLGYKVIKSEAVFALLECSRRENCKHK